MTTWWITSKYAARKHMSDDGGYRAVCGLRFPAGVIQVAPSNHRDVCAKCADVVLREGM